MSTFKLSFTFYISSAQRFVSEKLYVFQQERNPRRKIKFVSWKLFALGFHVIK